MKEIITQIRQSINLSDNVFDIYILIYDILRKKNSDYNSSREQYIESEKLNVWTVNLQNFIDKLVADDQLDIDKKKYLFCIIPKESYNELLLFLKMIQNIIDDYSTNTYKCKHVYRYRYRISKKEKVGYLNSSKTYHIGKVIHRRNHFIEEIVDESKRFKMDCDIGENICYHTDNLLVVEATHDDYSINLFRIEDEYLIDMIREKEKNYSIATIPMSGDINLLDYERREHADGEHIFINKINGEENYLLLLERIMCELIKLDVDIVVFPEMVFTERMIKFMQEFLNNNRRKMLLAICGSRWYERNNECTIITGNGCVLGTQKKLNRYRIDSKLVEDLNICSKDKVINLYDLEGFGRFCTPICADFVTKTYSDHMMNYGANVCFVPTYTKSLRRFSHYAEKIGNANYGTVFLSNCCLKDPIDQVSLSYIPSKDDGSLTMVCKCKEEQKCENKLCDAVFIVRISGEGTNVEQLKLSLSDIDFEKSE